jgi:hypothetical protein
MPAGSKSNLRGLLRNAFVLLPLIVFLGLTLTFFIQLRSNDESILPSTLIGKVAPNLELPALSGLAVSGKSVPGITKTK